MDRRSFITKAGLIGVGATAGISLWSEAQAHPEGQSTKRLVILHTNDTHSRLDPFPDDGRKWGGLGGIARRAALVQSIRATEPNVLLLDSGDIVQGTPYFNFFGGEPELKAMSAMGYDGATLGNHDFDNGLMGLERMLPHAAFPYLCANYDFGKTELKGRFEPYKVFDKGGVKIGVFGLGIAFEGLVLPTAYGATVWQDPLPIARQMVDHLRQKLGCDYIICLSHLGLSYGNDKVSDRVLAKATPGLDLILGGHTHTFMDQPERVLHPDGQETIINQVGWAGVWLGQIEVEFGTGQAPKTSARLPYALDNKIVG